jgi:hypothetical protein
MFDEIMKMVEALKEVNKDYSKTGRKVATLAPEEVVAFLAIKDEAIQLRAKIKECETRRELWFCQIKSKYNLNKFNKLQFENEDGCIYADESED